MSQARTAAFTCVCERVWAAWYGVYGRLSSYQRMLLGYTGGDRAVRSRAQGVACGGARVRTDTTGVILLLLVVWIVEGSSGRSASGMAAGIWCSGVFLTTYDLRLEV